MEPFRSLHLTEGAYGQAESLFNAFISRDLDLYMQTTEGMQLNWDSFDSVYLYLYAALLRKKHSKISNDISYWPRIRNCERSERGLYFPKSIVKVDHIIDMDLENDSNPHFLLSEFAVLSLIDFRNAFKTTVELEAEVVDVDVGCVTLTSEVDLPMPEVNLLKPGISDESNSDNSRLDAARDFISRRLSSERWHLLSRRFLVKHQWIDKSLTF